MFLFHLVITIINHYPLRNKPDERETAALIDRHQNRQAMNEADQLAVAMINTSDYILRLKCLIYKSEFDGRDGLLKVFLYQLIKDISIP